MGLSEQIKETYRQASQEVDKKTAAFWERYKKRAEQKKKDLDAGKITRDEYQRWMQTQMFTGDRWKEKLSDITQTYVDADKKAREIIGGTSKNVFVQYANSTAKDVGKHIQGGYSFDIYDQKTVERLLKENPDLLPKWKIDEPKDYKWNKDRVRNAITEGIVQGESIPSIQKRLIEGLATSNAKKMTLFARTAITGAQNAGRMERLHEATQMGIKVQKKWLSTHDARTREDHSELDGQTVDIDEPFETKDGRQIMFPGDPAAPPELVYNCRCTLIYVYSKQQQEIHIEEPPEEKTPGKPNIGETMHFKDSRTADEYFRGSTYETRMGGINRTRGYGVSEDESKPATKWQNKLTHDQFEALSDYSGMSYESINNYLRGIWDKQEAKDNHSGHYSLDTTIKHMDAGIKKFDLQKPITVYRTCEREFIDRLQEGSIFHDEGYGSTSVLPIPVASGDVHMEIDVPAGKGVGAYMEGVSWKEGEEFEFLLGRGADYYVEKKEIREDGIYVKVAIAGFTR